MLQPKLYGQQSLYFYSDESTKIGKSGAEVVGYGRRKMIDQRRYHLGNEMEAIDADLIAITKATKKAGQHNNEYTKRIWIFCDRKNAIRKLATQNDKLGQLWCLEIKNNIH